MYCDTCNRKLFVCLGCGVGSSPRFVDSNNGVIEESREGPVRAPQRLYNTPLLAVTESYFTFTSMGVMVVPAPTLKSACHLFALSLVAFYFCSIQEEMSRDYWIFLE